MTAPAPSATSSSIVNNAAHEEDVRTIYQDIQDRINQASMFTRNLVQQSQQCQNIYEKFQADLAENRGDKNTLERIASIAKRALLDIEWDLDKRITISQIQISYVSILRSINIAPEDDLDTLDPETAGVTDISLVLAKQARDTMYRALEEIDEAPNKAVLQSRAIAAHQSLVKIRSSLVKEKTFYQLQALIGRIIEQESDNQEIIERAELILIEARDQLYLADENIVISPEQASRIIVGVSQKLAALAPEQKGA